jgi:signal transduction histidine kinase
VHSPYNNGGERVARSATFDPAVGSEAPNARHKEASILAIDDERANLALLDRILRRAGYVNIVLLSDSREAAAVLSQSTPDIVLLDLHMPHVDGFGVLADISKYTGAAYVPVIVMTADITMETRRRALSVGAHDFITKPFDVDEVLLRIANLLETRYLHHALSRHNEDLDALVRERTAVLLDSLEQLHTANDDRRRLLFKLETLRGEEQRRIANDIHDDALQSVIAAQMGVQMLVAKLDDEGVREDFAEIQGLMRDAIDRLRAMMFELRNDDLDAGIATVLERHLKDLARVAGITYTLKNEWSSEPAGFEQLMTYRIAREALTNIRKHVSNCQVTVELLDQDGGYFVRIHDQGPGFDVSAGFASVGHLGLSLMQERAEAVGGRAHIESIPGEGTFVEFWIPQTPHNSAEGVPQES